MNSKQIYLYRWLANECRKAMRRFGRALTTADWERERKQIHVDAGAVDPLTGEGKSSLDLTNEEFTKVKARFLYWSDPLNLKAQLEIAREPYIKWRFLVDDLLDRISAHLEAIGRGHQAVHRGPGREGYLLNMARRLGGRREELALLENVNGQEKAKIMAALMIRYDQVTAPEKQPGHGDQSPTRRGKAPRRRPFDAPSRTPKTPEPAVALPACIKTANLTELDTNNDDPF